MIEPGLDGFRGGGRWSMYSIGEFSRITGLTVKTLRFYHDQGLLVPSCVDAQSGYRYYAPALVDKARAISELRRLEVPLADVAAVLAEYDDEADLAEFLARHRQSIEARLAHYRAIAQCLDQILQQQREAQAMSREQEFQVQEKELPPLVVGGIRMRGKYSDCGPTFARLGKALGFRIRGKAMMLIYDSEYKADDADFEPCMPVRAGTKVDGVAVRELPGGPAVTLVHRGPYDQLGRSYARVFDYLHQRGLRATSPCREVYLKGPGMIFKGNPEKYLTEIQVLVEGEA